MTARTVLLPLVPAFILVACAPRSKGTSPAAADCCQGVEPYEVPDLSTAPSFPGGDAAMVSWLGNRLNKPKDATDIKEGPLVQFLVTCTGELQKVELKVPAHPGMDSLALKAVREMPTWSPGKIKDRTVCTLNVIQVHFD